MTLHVWQVSELGSQLRLALPFLCRYRRWISHFLSSEKATKERKAFELLTLLLVQSVCWLPTGAVCARRVSPE